MTINLPYNPLSSSGQGTKNYLILESTDNDSLNIGIRGTMSGFPYSSSFEVHGLIEVKTVDPRSEQVAVRTSMNIEWLDQPWMMDNLISVLLHNQAENEAAARQEFQLQTSKIIVEYRNEDPLNMLMGEAVKIRAPEPFTHTCTSLWLAGIASLFSVIGGVSYMRKRIAQKPQTLRDVDQPLAGNELSHYDLYVD